ncbi:MAG: O-methyltransferase [Rhodospirillaceae bacterium]|nr:O-methyltransferase [Rhodospirillaceae bacterium]MYH37385.1 O-methyltransferase [Rhodospirillaceae bacterium]MYK13140.1 O-methyltransferase [Rhodospirillaceae bacterium]MYK59856.1 O-methyltransferase [Rhodospirillaceae bacterium]
MSRRTDQLSDALHAYMLRWGVDEPAPVRALREDTRKLSQDGWQSSPEQAQFMALLAGAIGARRFLEIGTFTGYCTLRMALALPEDGRVVACDITDEFVEKAGRRHWRESGMEDRIDLRIGPAAQTLEELLADPGPGSFDMAFIDADKEDYPVYFSLCAQLVRPNGLVLIDNTFWGGRVADPDDTRKSTAAIREATRMAFERDDFEVAMVPIGDGLLMARRLR